MRKRFRYRSAIIAINLALAAARTANALTITPTYDSTITGDPNAAAIEATINAAIITYESLLLNPVNVSVTFSEMASGLGSSNTFRKTDTYADYLSKLTSSATSSSDATAVGRLPVQTNNPVDGNANMDLSTANARALGIFTGNSTVGGSISLNISATNITRGGTFSASKYDLFAVVSHEMDEVLGLGSALVNGNTGSPTPPTGAVTPEDLFRYTPAGARSFDYNSSTQAYFSIDGTTDIAQFNQNSTSANNADFGDWATTSTHRVQDAFGTPGITVNLGSAETTALDVIGYTLLTSLTWNPNNTFASGAPTDGSGTWTTASGATWYNGTSSSVWANSPVQNAQFGTPGTASTTAYTVTLGSPITAGTIVFANANYTIAGGGNSLTIANGITAAVNATISANIILGGANTWQVASGATLAVSGNISENSAGLGLTKQGPGVLTLSGTNSYTGGTTIAAGTLSLLSSGALPAGGNVTVSGGALDINGQSPSIGNLTFGDGVSTSAATLIDSGATKGSLILAGDITYVGTFNNGFTYFPAANISANLQLAAGAHAVTSADTSLANNYDVVISGVLSGAGGLTKNGANTYLALTGANTYSGATIINNAYLFAGATNTLSASSAVTINSSGVLDLNPVSTQSGITPGSYNQVIGSLAGAGQVTLGSATLSIGNDGSSTTYSGSIFGAGGITKIGIGTLTLTGTSNYSGPTVINGGTLQIGAGGGAGAINSASAVSGSAGTLAVDVNYNMGFSNTISGSVGVTNIGSGVLFLLANNSYSGTTTIGSGETIYAGSNSAAGSIGSGPLVNNGAFNISRTDSPTFANQISGSGSLTIRSTGAVTLSGNSTGFSGPTNINSATLIVSGSISGSTVTVFSSGTLAGTGATGPVTAQSGATVLPGSSTGSGLLSTGTFSLQSGAHLSLELGGTANTGTAGTQYSELSVTGSVTLGGDLQISLFGGYAPKVNDIFYIILNDGIDSIPTRFSNAPSQGSTVTFGGVQYMLNYAANGDAGPTANDVSIQVLAVPEPGACTLLLAGLGMAAGCGLRRRR